MAAVSDDQMFLEKLFSNNTALVITYLLFILLLLIICYLRQKAVNHYSTTIYNVTDVLNDLRQH